MRESNDGPVLAILLISIAALVMVFTGLWLVFGMLVCALLVAGLALGFGAARRSKPVRFVLFFLICAYIASLGAMAWLEGSTEASRLVLGFPPATSVLVYVIWPVPLLSGILFGLVFPTSILPEEKLREFLATHGRGKESA